MIKRPETKAVNYIYLIASLILVILLVIALAEEVCHPRRGVSLE